MNEIYVQINEILAIAEDMFKLQQYEMEWKLKRKL